MAVLSSISGELGFTKSEFDFITQYMLQKTKLLHFTTKNLLHYTKYLANIRKELRGFNLEKFSAYSESEYHGVANVLQQDINFKYTYQRYDLTASIHDWLAEIYHTNSRNFLSNGLFVMSGMSAILVSILGIKHYSPNSINIKISKNGYYEINDLLTKSLYNLNKTYFEDESAVSPIDIAVLDTSSHILPKQKYWETAKFIIIDTTCWNLGDTNLTKLLLTLQTYQGIIILIRSHIKLDCFGLELNRLGSIVVLTAKNSNPKTRLAAIKLHKSCQEINGNIGCNLHLYDYYPWLLDNKFQQLAAIRTTRIKQYTKLIYARLYSMANGEYEIIKPQHELFILIKLLKHYIPEPIVQYAQKICNIANAMGIAILPAPSFALCCTSFDGFKSKVDEAIYLRIAPSPNINTAQAEQTANFFVEFLLNKGFFHENVAAQTCLVSS